MSFFFNTYPSEEIFVLFSILTLQVKQGELWAPWVCVPILISSIRLLIKLFLLVFCVVFGLSLLLLFAAD